VDLFFDLHRDYDRGSVDRCSCPLFSQEWSGEVGPRISNSNIGILKGLLRLVSFTG
jgi:hypothetical protein